MEWTECISKAISYIEDNITEELTMEDIAKQAMISPFYFQKGFALRFYGRRLYKETQAYACRQRACFLGKKNH